MARQLMRLGLCLSSLLAFAHSYPTEDEKSLLMARADQRLVEFGEMSEELEKREDESEQSFFQFATRPDIQAPRWDISIVDHQKVGPGYIFIAPYSGLNQEKHDQAWVGPFIYDQEGELIWSGTPQFQHWNVFDFHPVTTNGVQYLSLLYMHQHAGILLNSSYGRHTTQPLNPAWPAMSDMHEFHVLPNNTAMSIFLDKVPATRAQSLKVGYDGECKAKFRGFLEMDLQTGKEIFRWNARNHIGLDESMKIAGTYKEMCEGGWDLLHLNAMDKFPDGDYLLSSRHTNTLYKINHYNGSIVWRLGGVKNDFQKDFIFSRQHHARVQSQNSTHTVVTLFDNAIGTEGNETATNDISRGLMISLETTTKPMKATVLKYYGHPNHHITNSRGSMEMMPNGNAFICWTYGSFFSEHTPDGTVVMEGRTKGGFNTYRSFKMPWVGKPDVPPDVKSQAVEKTDRVQTVGYVSWNGATEVKTWNMHRSNQDGDYTEFLVSAPRRGFETTVTWEGYASYIVMEGLDANGNSLGKSRVINTYRAGNMNRTLVEEDADWQQAHTTQIHTDASETTDEDFSSAPAATSSSSSSNDDTNNANFDPQVWAEKATPLLTSTIAAYIYGVLTVLFLGWIISCVRRRRSTGGAPAWWRGAIRNGGRAGGSGGGRAKYDPVWDNQSVEMLRTMDEDSKGHRDDNDDDDDDHDHDR